MMMNRKAAKANKQQIKQAVKPNPDLFNAKDTSKTLDSLEGNLYNAIGSIIDKHVKELKKKTSSTKSKKKYHKIFANEHKQFTKQIMSGIRKVDKL